MHLRLGFLVAPRARLGLGLGIGLGQGQCDLPPLTMLAGTWNSNVCPGLAVSGTVSATWSWLGCALEEEFGQVCVGPGFSATFCPIGETHTSFCPGIHVSGMFVSIVVIFCPGGAGIWLSAGGGASGCGVV